MSTLSIRKISSALSKLATKRPVFYSEADFQHALAWELQLAHRGAQIRLEKQVAKQGPRVHLDLLFRMRGKETALELKYKTRRGQYVCAGETYSLRDQSAQDIGRNGFIQDILRLERFVQNHKGSVGFAILLTNDRTYWLPAKKRDSVDSEFHLNEGRILKGTVAWGAEASAGTKLGREKPIELIGTYPMHWHDYSSLGEEAHGQFRYVIALVTG